MRELTDTQKEQLQQHELWVDSNGQKGVQLCWTDADLSYVNLHGCKLGYSDLSGTDLSYANLRGAILCCAEMYGTNLCGANLSYANLRGTNLCGAKYINAISVAGSRQDTLIWNYHPDIDGGLMLTTGCFWGTLAEFTAAVERVHGVDEFGIQYCTLIELAKLDAIHWKRFYSNAS